MLPPPSSLPLSSLSLSDLHTLLLPIRHNSSIFQNWARTFRSTTIATFFPTTVEQVRLVVELARREGKELRALGSGHSPSDLACTEGYGVNVDGLNQVLEVDLLNTTFHSQGGILLSTLNSSLRSSGLSLSSLGSISDQTLAGALSTATHGSGVSFGNLSSFVLFLDLVLPLPDAPIVRVSREDDEELFLSALCGLGAVGVIVGVGMKAERKYKLEEECFSMKWSEFVEHWEEVAESSQHVRCWWFPQVGEVKVSRLNRTTKSITPPPNAIYSYIFDTFLSKHFHAVALTISRIFPNYLPFHAKLMYALVHRPAPMSTSPFLAPFFSFFSRAKKGALEIEEKQNVVGKKEKKVLGDGGLQIPFGQTPPLTPPMDEMEKEVELAEEEDMNGSGVLVKELPKLTESTYRVDESEKVFCYDCGFPQYTYEGAVPYSQTKETLIALEAWQSKELADPNGLRGHFPIEIRFTEKDDIWLSPTYGMRGTYIGAIQYRPFNLPVPYKSIFRTFESILLSHSGRPHWAKSHNCSRTQLEGIYEKFHDFLRVRERVDPEKVLVNAYLKRHLLGRVGEECDVRRFKSTGR